MIAAVDAPPPALSQPAAIRFAPPLGEILRYETRVERAGLVFRMTHAVRFVRDGAGYRMEAMQIDHAVIGPATAAALLEAMLAPMRGVPVTLALGRDGAPGGVIDAQGAWVRVLAGRAAAARWVDAQAGLSPALRAGMKRMLAEASERDDAGREAALAEWPAALVAFAAAPLPLAGTVPIEDGALAGTARAAGGDARTVRFAIDLAGADVARHDDVAIDRASGLVERSVSRRTTPGSAASADTLVRIVERLRSSGN